MPSPPGPGPRFRQKMVWLFVMTDDMRTNKLTTMGTQDRADWRSRSTKADPRLRSDFGDFNDLRMQPRQNRL